VKVGMGVSYQVRGYLRGLRNAFDEALGHWLAGDPQLQARLAEPARVSPSRGLPLLPSNGPSQSPVKNTGVTGRVNGVVLLLLTRGEGSAPPPVRTVTHPPLSAL
jgi:hypothetical protein